MNLKMIILIKNGQGFTFNQTKHCQHRTSLTSFYAFGGVMSINNFNKRLISHIFWCCWCRCILKAFIKIFFHMMMMKTSNKAKKNWNWLKLDNLIDPIWRKKSFLKFNDQIYFSINFFSFLLTFHCAFSFYYQ